MFPSLNYTGSRFACRVIISSKSLCPFPTHGAGLVLIICAGGRKEKDCIYRGVGPWWRSCVSVWADRLQGLETSGKEQRPKRSSASLLCLHSAVGWERKNKWVEFISVDVPSKSVSWPGWFPVDLASSHIQTLQWLLVMSSGTSPRASRYTSSPTRYTCGISCLACKVCNHSPWKLRQTLLFITKQYFATTSYSRRFVLNELLTFWSLHILLHFHLSERTNNHIQITLLPGLRTISDLSSSQHQHVQYTYLRELLQLWS